MRFYDSEQSLRTISHNLRTPLTGILGMSEILSHETLTQTQREYIDDIRQAGAQLLSAINEMFEKEKNEIFAKNKTMSEEKSKIRILLVEDEPIVQKVHRIMLEKMNCDIDIAVNGQQALTLFNANQYDAIILDIGLPDMSGIDVAIQIRNSKINIPIIALTADVTDGTQKKCLDAGINTVATKPIDSEHLQQLLMNL